MTVRKLIAILQRALLDGHGNCAACIDKQTFTHPLESDGACILDINGCRFESVQMLNEDGGMWHGKHGREKYRATIVLYGASYQPPETRDEEPPQ